MGHSHDHAGHAAARRRIWPLAVAAALIGGFMVVEFAVGFIVDSLALIADAGHMATDLVALLMGLSALLLARHGSTTAQRSFGWHRAEVFSAVINAVLLLAVGAYVLYEAIERLGSHPTVPGRTLIAVALLGLAINVIVMVLLRADAKESIAVRGAYMEVIADALGSIGVLIAGVFALFTGSGYADIVVAVLIALWVVPRALRLAGDALRILNQQAPKDVDVDAVEAQLAAIPGVVDVHDLHVWTLTTGMDVATVHVTADADGAPVLAAAQEILADHGLEHATVQVETGGRSGCRDAELSW
ncbi:MAG: cation diffusion facilitator family transporter [Gordonia sp. (in: high G+C Gram-positive bacteria)]|uniref:cation diffusion facilitator family transporter n=1 Tax=Gordonia sp. (in: high G+C Gram-positive bacteria) TaxID=84139 RepID=UPI0039E3E858